jgi:hemerythrin-like metal-binding protein
MAERLRWDESMAAGFLEVDEEHRQLLDHANRLLACARDGPPWDGILDAVGIFASAFAAHVVAEEWVMRWVEYPGAEKHAEEHRAFTGQLERLRAALEGGPGSKVELDAQAQALAAALVRHIEGEDRRIGTYAFGHVLSG